MTWIGGTVAASGGRRSIVLGGSFLIGLSTLQVEFDFGVPQFQQVFHPLLIALAAGIGLVAVRLRGGPGAALGAVAVFWLARGTLTVLVAPVLGRSTQHIPLFVVEALAVEGVARFIGRDRQLTFGALAGAAIGTVGVASEWVWSQVWMPLPWNGDLFPVGAALGLVGGVAGGLVGAGVGRALLPADVPRQPVPRAVFPVAWVVIVLALFVPLRPSAPTGTSVDLAVGAERDGQAPLTVVLSDPDQAAHPRWFHVLAWQGARNGDGGLKLIALTRVGPDRWEAAEPVPVSGTWKTMVRLHQGSAMRSAPVYLPADAAIPADEVPAASGVRDLVREKSLLQREAVGGSPLQERIAYALLASVATAWLVTMAWGLRRLDPGTEHPGAGAPPLPLTDRPGTVVPT